MWSIVGFPIGKIPCLLTTDHRPPTTDHRPPTTDHRPPTQFTKTLYRALGLILICAGVIKFASVSPPAFSTVVAIIPSWAWPLIPLFEILLGVWLVSGWMRFGAWIATLFTLLVFALHNLELLSAGRSSCGCLGSSVDTSPRVMLGFDVFVALLLLWQRRRWAGWPTTDSPHLRQAATALTVMAVALGAGL